MTDQQAPEREVIEFLRFGFTDPSRANVVEALIKQRDELSAEVERVHVTTANLMKETCRQYQERAEKAEAERDEALNQLDSARHSVDVLEKRVASLLAASAAREIAMRDRAAALVKHGCKCRSCKVVFNSEENPHYDEECDKSYATWDTADAASISMAIRAIPLSPDGQQALDDVRAKAYEAGKVVGALGIEEENPYRTQPSRSSDAGKSEDRG